MRATLASIALASVAPCAHSFAAQVQPNVILLTLDGVRWQEVFHGTDPLLDRGRSKPIFKHVFAELKTRGVSFGDRRAGGGFSASNIALVSLPGYRSIMTGKFDLFCISNECGRIREESVQERIVRELKLAPGQVASIASWAKMADALEHKPGSTFVNVGVMPIPNRTGNGTLEWLHRQQSLDARPSGNRRDKYTFSYALRYLEANRPRFLYIGLDESDAYADRNDYANYVTTLQQYDEWIKELMDLLGRMGDYGKNTTLLVTTDHGRGDGANWQHHRLQVPESRWGWLLVLGPNIEKAHQEVTKRYSHASIRPTIEVIFGLQPRTCVLCGHPIREIGRGSLVMVQDEH